MFRKFHPHLHQQAINFMAIDPDFQTVLKRFHSLDNELRVNCDCRNCRRPIGAGGPSNPNPSNIKFSPRIKQDDIVPKCFRASHPPDDNLITHSKEFPARKCYNCHNTGHFSRDCPNPPNPQTRTSEMRQIEGQGDMENDGVAFPIDSDDQNLYEGSENENP